MKPSKPISDWTKIFLDTSFILDYLSDSTAAIYSPEVKERILLVQRLMAELDDEKNLVTNRTFYISAITVGELQHFGRPQTIKDIIGIFNAVNVTFVDYTKDTALLMNNTLRSVMTEDQLKRWQVELRDIFKETRPGYVSARRWLADDLKIVASAKSVRGLDVVLTTDCNTFKPIADRFNVPCISMRTEELPVNIFGEIDLTRSF